MKIFVWVAHPNMGSLGESLAKAYEHGAREQGAEVRNLRLGEMDFDMGALKGYGCGPRPQLEPSLKEFQDSLLWCDHFFMTHPLWWGSMPAQAKAVLDRTLLPGFAFKFGDSGLTWDKLLKGRSAEVLLTSDTPPWMDTVFYLASWRRVLKNQILGFCGLKVTKMKQIGPVKSASSHKIETWLKLAEAMGTKAASRY